MKHAMAGFLASAICTNAIAGTVRYLVTFDDEANAAAALAEVAARNDMGWRHVRHSSVGGEVIELPEEDAAVLEHLPGVVRVTVSPRMQLLEGTSSPWYFADGKAGINLTAAFEHSRGAGATVAVIDTGITPHTGVAALARGYDFIDDPGIARDGDGRDADPSDEGTYGTFTPAGGCGTDETAKPSIWHGTHVAGIVSEVAPAATIIPVRVGGGCGAMDMFDIVDAITWASGGQVEGVESLEKPADVINLSLGGEGDCWEPMAEAISGAVARGSIVVAAAGNSRWEMVNAPASCPGVVSVAALDDTGRLATYATTRPKVTVSAPGGAEVGSTEQLINVPSNSGAKGIGLETRDHSHGSSLATPMVAGVIALMRSVKPALSTADAERFIRVGARPDCGPHCGAGRLDAGATMNALVAEGL